MATETSYPKRLIEVDLPIKRISAHARKEKSIRHGHISTLHIWWARRPLAACRAIICASLWPDPADSRCPQLFRDRAAQFIASFAVQAANPSNRALHRSCSPESLARWIRLSSSDARVESGTQEHLEALRYALLDFIADFSDWDNSTLKEYLDTSRALTLAAHEALGGAAGTKPLVVDPFAGGGAIPVETLRVGADAWASDLNPVSVLLNKVQLEYIPKYGQRLINEIHKWGQLVKERAEDTLAEFYPKDPDGATPIAYLWARTMTCEGPGCGTNVPMMNQTWIKKKGSPTYAFALKVSSEPKNVEIQIVKDPIPSDVKKGTAGGGAVTCPICGYTTPAARVRSQGLNLGLGSRLIGTILALPGSSERKFRSPSGADLKAVEKASKRLELDISNSKFLKYLKTGIPISELRRISVPLYGITTFDKLFQPRQRLAFQVLSDILDEVVGQARKEISDPILVQAIHEVLTISVSSILHYNMNLSTYLSNGMVSAFVQGTSLAMRSDFAEANPTMPRLVGGLDYSLTQICRLLERMDIAWPSIGTSGMFSATKIPLPDGAASLVFTDPPYYDSIPYSHLSDVFYLWLKANLEDSYPSAYVSPVTDKEWEIVQDRPHSKSPTTKGADFFEQEMVRALDETHRLTKDDQLQVVVFAHKSTQGWEAMLGSLISAGWVVTSSWPIDTERPARMNAYQNASLLSSIHVVCRPRLGRSIGEWRTVLGKLPRRIHDWMPRLAQSGVVGADAIFACLGPAIQIFSQYSQVEKASGEVVPLREYLEQVWATVSREALTMIFEGADATGFEEDARLTAIWLWTLSTGKSDRGGPAEGDVEDIDDQGDAGARGKSDLTGFNLEYDAARKLAQGLGAHLENLPSLVETKGDKARLLGVAERARYLFGTETNRAEPKDHARPRQPSLFSTSGEIDEEKARPGFEQVPELGQTLLDRVHQSMLIFASGRGPALQRFLVEEGAGRDQRFWRLAQALSALYPNNTDEKRWSDGVMARKTALGL